MSDALCPSCNTNLQKIDDTYSCDACKTRYREIIHCPKCDAPVETLKACGALSYFCNHCNELQSKSSVIRRYVAL